MYPLALSASIVDVTSAALVNALPVSPVSTTDSATAPFSVLSVSLFTSMKCVTATCDPSLTYVIVVFSVGSVGKSGTSYPLVGSFGSFGVNGFPFGPTGVVPGMYGTTGFSVGVPGFVGSAGVAFGYGFGFRSAPAGGVIPSGTTGTYEPSLRKIIVSSLSLSVA